MRIALLLAFAACANLVKVRETVGPKELNHFNRLRDKGMQAAEAVIEAATLRLRPILMTTGAMVLGALPLALAKGAGAEARQPIGWVIVGGLLLGTVFTLFVIPTAYMLLTGGQRRKAPAHEPAAAE